jgi:hypothetical protein
LDQARVVHGGVYSAESAGIDVVDRRTELRVIEEVEELGAEVQPISFRGSANCLMTEKSVLTKSGPVAGTREALPNSPAGGATKQED